MRRGYRAGRTGRSVAHPWGFFFDAVGSVLDITTRTSISTFLRGGVAAARLARSCARRRPCRHYGPAWLALGCSVGALMLGQASPRRGCTTARHPFSRRRRTCRSSSSRAVALADGPAKRSLAHRLQHRGSDFRSSAALMVRGWRVDDPRNQRKPADNVRTLKWRSQWCRRPGPIPRWHARGRLGQNRCSTRLMAGGLRRACCRALASVAALLGDYTGPFWPVRGAVYTSHPLPRNVRHEVLTATFEHESDDAHHRRLSRSVEDARARRRVKAATPRHSERRKIAVQSACPWARRGTRPASPAVPSSTSRQDRHPREILNKHGITPRAHCR